MHTTRMQDLYWLTQTIHDKCFALETQIYRCRRRGHQPNKIYNKYFALLDELRQANAEMLMIDGD